MNESQITDQDVAEADALYQQWVAAIEKNPASLRELTDKFFVAWRQYNIARDKLDAVPVASIMAIIDSVPVDSWTRKPLAAVKKWLAVQGITRGA